MAIKEQDKVFYEELANGDKVINLPITRVNNVEGLGRSANTAYVVGDVVYVDNNKKVALKCTQAGTTSNSELNVSTASIGNVITDGTVKWQVCNRTSDVTSVNGKTGDVVIDLPVGHMYWSVEPNVPAGRLPALGATYNRVLYADLWEWANSVGVVKSESEWQAIASANDGNCAYYSSGDGSSTFRVPSIKCWVKGASGIEEVGSYLQAGLPNVAGSTAIEGVGKSDGQHSTNSGALYPIYNSQHTGVAVNNLIKGATIEIDASRSNPIYGNSDTVQPPSIVGQWFIVAFGVAHNIGEADVANVMQAVEQVQTGLGTLEQGVGTLEQGVGTAIDYIIESYRNGTEWYEVYKSGKVRQGGKSNNAQSWRPITLSVPMANTDYNVQVTSEGYQKDLRSGVACSNVDRTTTSLSVASIQTNNTYSNQTVDWKVEGQGA